MRATTILAAILIAYAGSGHAALGGAPEEYSGAATAITSSATAGGASYVLRSTSLESGTQVKQYLLPAGTVFAVTWEGPILPDLKALLGKYFATLVAESERAPRAGRSRVTVNTPEVVINSGGHMRAFEGGAWLPGEFPAGFAADDLR